MNILFLLLHTKCIEWNYSFKKTKSKPAKEVSSEHKDYCVANYKFYGKKNNYKLEKLLVMFRHGDRSPVHNFSEGWKNKKCVTCDISGSTISKCDTDTCNLGELSAKGYDQAQKLGKFIKNNYKKLLFDSSVDLSAISCRVTKIGRTHSTLIGVLKGFDNITQANIKKIPENDGLLKYQNCEYLNSKMLINLTIGDETTKKFKNANLNSGKDLMYKADEIRCAMCNNIELEEENKDNLFNDIIKLSNNTWIKQMTNTSRDEISKNIIFGRFANELLEEIESDSILSLISAHDGSIAMILTAFTSKNQNWPPYASAVFIEIWSKYRKQFVRLIYNDSQIDFDEYSEEFIPLEVFTNYIKSMKSSERELSDMCNTIDNKGINKGISNLLITDNIDNKYNKYIYQYF